MPEMSLATLRGLMPQASGPFDKYLSPYDLMRRAPIDTSELTWPYHPGMLPKAGEPRLDPRRMSLSNLGYVEGVQDIMGPEILPATRLGIEAGIHQIELPQSDLRRKP